MSYRRASITLETNAAGAATGYIPVMGAIEAVHYIKDDYADGVDFTITDEDTAESLWTDTNVNAKETLHPVVLRNTGTDGAALADPNFTRICVVGQVKIVIAQGGDTKSGTFFIDYED